VLALTKIKQTLTPSRDPLGYNWATTRGSSTFTWEVNKRWGGERMLRIARSPLGQIRDLGFIAIFVAVTASLSNLAAGQSQAPTLDRLPVLAGFDGTWQATGMSEASSHCSLSWLIRLTVAQGQASGFFAVDEGSQPLENLVLQPDGAFVAVTRPISAHNGRSLPAGQLSGRLSGDTITVSYTNGRCGTRRAEGTRLSR
jgi:hypothetical protein